MLPLAWDERGGELELELLLENFWSRPPQLGLSARSGAAHTCLSSGLGTDSAGYCFADEGTKQSPNFVFSGKGKPGVVAIV